MTMKLLFSFLIVFFSFNFAIAENSTSKPLIDSESAGYQDIITEAYTEIHALKDKQIFIRKLDNDNFKVTLYSEYNPLYKDHGYYLDMDVEYNNLHKKLKYILDKRAVPSVSIEDVQITDLFCNKKYLVVTVSEYSFAYQPSAENSYVDIYMDLNPDNKEFSLFDYNLYEFDTKGPIDLQIIERTTKQKCHQNSIEFVYDNQ
ncbi:hypothetical protein N5853_14235 (plasmid) [Bartonella sp. HY329]|uniref:hypothetical protein n=1 Tax=unclassified Bartonella TaxID=2645622 RepID=UPI0021C617C9|nr:MULTISPECIES: hypothetical protein [unclassified Bartonella]UXM96474.1 hypothetical protein N5853_14235 [Bartonella sp. HY329]UXN10797.1 hypothetical protein N5852_14240 [Bartonella sp. HY328]